MDFEEIFEQLFDDENGDEAPTPRWRATIRRDRLKLTGWAPWLASGGPAGNLFQSRQRAGVAIADLTVAGEDDGELMVSFHSPGRDRDAAEELIVDWARTVGYHRVWLSSRLVTLEGSCDRIGLAEVRCPTCHARWKDGSPEFWLHVRRSGTFPNWCFLCGSELPPWEVHAEPGADDEPVRRNGRTGRWGRESANSTGEDT